jgi:membrane associated rhomboid family serine protease
MFTNLPVVTKTLLILNCVIFALQLAVGPDYYNWFSLWPISPDGWQASLAGYGFLPWQLLTYGFLHADPGHVLFNMLALLMFGAPVEYQWGKRPFLVYYLACLVGAGVCQLAVATWSAFAGYGLINSVGASGAIYGLVVAYGVTLPHQRISIFPLPVFFRARTVAIIFAVTSLLYGILGTRDGVAHFAHLGGMLTGWLILRFQRKDPPFRRGRRTARLRVVR